MDTSASLALGSAARCLPLLMLLLGGTTVCGQIPVITSQPASRTAFVGGQAWFAVTAVGAGPLAYQWRKDGTNLANGGSFSGTGTATLWIFPIRDTDAGAYSVVASNAYGVVSSTEAILSFAVVAAWGANYSGQTTVPAGLTNVVAIAGGASHSLALRADGTVAAWGYNDYGQTNVPVGLTNVIAVAAGVGHSLALRADGMLYVRAILKGHVT
jgi:hypothetical protein